MSVRVVSSQRADINSVYEVEIAENGITFSFLHTSQIILSRSFFNYFKINSSHRLQSERSLVCLCRFAKQSPCLSQKRRIWLNSNIGNHGNHLMSMGESLMIFILIIIFVQFIIEWETFLLKGTRFRFTFHTKDVSLNSTKEISIGILLNNCFNWCIPITETAW
jgi:hypothetical protein